MALALGMTKRQLMREIDQHELAEWAAYERINGPIGGQRQDYLFAHLIRYLVMVNADPKKGYDGITLEKFLPKWDVQEEATDLREYSEEQVARDQAVFTAMAERMK